MTTKRSCHNCKALASSSKGCYCMLGHEIHLVTYREDYTLYAPLEPCPKPVTNKAYIQARSSE